MNRSSWMRVALIVLVAVIIVLLGLLIGPRLFSPDRQDVFVSYREPPTPATVSADTIIVRGDWSYPPFEFINEQGDPDGFNIEIIRRIGELMNLDLLIKLGPWDTVRRQLENGEIDVLAGMYKTRERDKRVDFTIPHFISSYGVFVPQNSRIKSLEELNDKRILVQRQDVGHDYLIENSIGKEIIALESWTELLPALKEGRGDCAVLSMMQGVRQLKAENTTGVRVITDPLFQRRYCIAVKEGEAELLATLNEGLNMLKSSGEYDRIFERWFGVYSEPGFDLQSILNSRTVQLFIFSFLILAILFLFFLFWTYALRRRVAIKTAELSSTLEELRQANNAKSRFLASVSHEVRTPLHGIIGMLRLLKKTALDQQQREITEMMNSSTVQLHRILSDLIDATRLEVGPFTLHPVSFRLKEIGSWVEPLLRRYALQKGLAFQFDIENDVVLYADQERLTQIIVNLAENAIKNTPTGYIKVQLKYIAEHLEILVQDSGRGIPESEREAIFSPFTQVESHEKISSAKETGMGLGLAIVKTIIDLMDGEIELESQPGEGSTFLIRIPVQTGLLSDEMEREHVQEKVPTRRRSHERLQILIAEDEAINRIYLERFLQGQGWDTTPAADGEAAWKALQEGSYDVVLMDLGMPKLGGLDVTALLREYEVKQNIPRTCIIALTAYADDDNLRRCREAGMDGFVSKPFKEQELVDEIQRLV